MAIARSHKRITAPMVRAQLAAQAELYNPFPPADISELPDLRTDEWYAYEPKTLVAVDMFTGRLMGYGLYAQLKALYEGPLLNSTCMQCARPDERDWLNALDHGVLRRLAAVLEVAGAADRERPTLIEACHLEVVRLGYLPPLDADLCLMPEHTLQGTLSDANVPSPRRNKRTTPTTTEDTHMAVAKPKAAAGADKPAATPAPAAKPKAAAKPAAAAKAADKGKATPKPAAPKPANVKPAAVKPAAAPKPAAKNPAAKPAPKPAATAKPAKPAAAAKAATKPSESRAKAETKNGVSKPLKADGNKGQVWATADKLHKAKKGKFTSADVIAELPGVNVTTIRVTLNQWCTFNEVQLPKAPRTVAA